MTLMRRKRDLWDPFDFMRDFQDGGNLSWPRGFEPDIEVKEEPNHYLVKADLPGIKKDEIDISVTGNLLTLKGQRREESENKAKDYLYSERIYGSFTRTLSLPTEVDADKIKAEYKDGVLQLTIPKAENAKPKPIKVEVK